jgi:hypothetical protein
VVVKAWSAKERTRIAKDIIVIIEVLAGAKVMNRK